LLRDKIDMHYHDELIEIQNKLFTIGSFLALDASKKELPNGKKRLDIKEVDKNDIAFLEKLIDMMDEQLPPMTNFILPGGHEQVSLCHISRSICRRAERKITQLSDLESLDENLIKYVNRLSDYLFILARKLSMDLHIKEIPWQVK